MSNPLKRPKRPAVVVTALVVALVGIGVGVLAATSGGTGATTDPAPAITSVSPNSGSVVGGTRVTITGSGFTGATAVDFGSAPATFTVNSATSITATVPTCADESPPCSFGSSNQASVGVTVITPGGTSSPSSAAVFTYYYPVPSVSSVSPRAGPVGGGTAVTITGNAFSVSQLGSSAGVTRVDFGSTAVTTGITVNSTGTQLTVTSPPASAQNCPSFSCTVDVTVTTPGGTTATSTADQFTYGPLVTTLSPNSGVVSGGTKVSVTGIGFTGATAVDFGATSATFTVNSNTLLTATVPVAPASLQSGGVVVVSVTTPSGRSPLNNPAYGQFTYINPTAPPTTTTTTTAPPTTTTTTTAPPTTTTTTTQPKSTTTTQPKSTTTTTTTTTTTPGSVPVSGVHQVFDATFGGSSLNTSVWDTCYPYGECNNYGNSSEEEWYTPAQDQVSGGALHLVADATPTAGKTASGASTTYPYASGMVTTYNSFNFTYGYVQVVAQLPGGTGTWPALWLAPENSTWPPEIDFMENWGSPLSIQDTYHYGTAQDQGQVASVITSAANLTTGYHTYGVDWEPGSLTYYLDGKVVATYTNSNVSSEPMYFIADLAIDGNAASGSSLNIQSVQIFQH